MARRLASLSGSNWSLIERAAAWHGVPVAELVRSDAVVSGEDQLGEPPPTTLTKGHAALIEALSRSVQVMVTLWREELLDAGRDEELDDLVAAARRTMAETMDDGLV